MNDEHELVEASLQEKAAAAPLLSIALVCQSNVNRSMEAHAALQDAMSTPSSSSSSSSSTLRWPISIESFGIGAKVRLPGESSSNPNVYEFGTPYEDMIADLSKKNSSKYENNGILKMLRRDAKVKLAPERFPLSAATNEPCSPFDFAPILDSVSSSPSSFDSFLKPRFNLVISFEHRVFDALTTVVEQARSLPHRPVHVINFNTPDNAKEAALAAAAVTKLVTQIVSHGRDWELHLDADVQQFESENKRQLLHRVLYV